MVLDTEHEEGRIRSQKHSHLQNKAVAMSTGTQNEELRKRENWENLAYWVRKGG